MEPVSQFHTTANEPPPSIRPASSFPHIQTPSAIPAFSHEKHVCGWVTEALREGQALIASELEGQDVEDYVQMVMGCYEHLKDIQDLPSYRSRYFQNRIAKNVTDIASAITDFRPIWQYKTFNALYQNQAEILDKLSTAWWYNLNIDLKLQLVVKSALTTGTAYAQIVFDPTLFNGIGDCDMVPRDYREVIPIRPNSKISIQDALGVIIHTRKTMNWLKARYPERAALVSPTSEGSLFTRMVKKQTVVTALDRLDMQRAAIQDFNIPTYNHFEVYVHDDSVNMSGQPVWVGPEPQGESPWGYFVAPGQPLYPRGRLIIVANLNVVLYDGPNPYWHGMFPVVKFTPDPWPWSFMGKSAVADAKQSQLLSNELLRGIVDNARKTLKPGAMIDKNAMPRSKAERLDTSMPGWKSYINPSVGQGMILEQPTPLPEFIMALRQQCNEDIDYVMGVLDMRALSQLQRMQGTGEVEELLENLGPSVRTRGRVLEAFMREMGDMMKGNFLQFYDTRRRFQILGPTGVDMQDFDFDPGTLVPDFAFSAFGDDMAQASRFFNVSVEGPALRSRSERAAEHVKSFNFHLEPNSLLSLAKVQDKLLYLQLFRMGILDPVTLWEKLEVPNTGAESFPKTVLERMQAAGQMGLVGAVSAAGRKSTGQEMPEMRSDMRVSESG